MVIILSTLFDFVNVEKYFQVSLIKLTKKMFFQVFLTFVVREKLCSIKTFYSNSYSLIVSDRSQTLDRTIKSQVVYHCATPAQPTTVMFV
jgi:hypothetical protein